MRYILAVLAFLIPSCAFAQGCGTTNPNCVVPTAPPGTSDSRAASTAFVRQNASASVTTNTDLKNLTGNSTTGIIYRQGFATPGDGGQMFYKWQAAACTLVAGAGDDGYQVKPNSGGGCWIAQIGSDVDLRVWGCGLGAANDSACLVNISTAVSTFSLSTIVTCSSTVNIKSWLFTNNNFWIQGKGLCTFNAAAAATTGDSMLDYRGSGPLTIEHVNFVAPIFDPNTYAAPVINKFIRINGPANGPVYGVKIRDVSFTGAQAGIQAFGVYDFDLEDWFSDRQQGVSISIGAGNAQSGTLNATTAHVRLAHGRCQGIGSYCWSMPNLILTTASLGQKDLNVYDVNVTFSGFVASKLCGDFVGDAMTTARIQMVGMNCRQGGLEVKGDPDTFGIPSLWQGINVDLVYNAVWDVGGALQLNFENTPSSPNLNVNNNYKVSTTWYPPPAWNALTYYDVGEAVQSNGFTFLAFNPGTSSSTAPTSTGVLSATVSNGGSGYTALASGTITWSAGGGGVCTVPPVLNVTTDTFGVINAVTSVATPGTCAPFPTAGGSTWNASGLGGGSGATFNLTFCNSNAGNAVVDGTVTWICVQATPIASGINAASQLQAVQVKALTNANLDVTAYNTSEGVNLLPQGSSDETIRNLTIRFTGVVNNTCLTHRAVSSIDPSKVGTITGLNIISPSCTCGRTDGGSGSTSCITLGSSDSTGHTNNFDGTISGGVITHQGTGVSSSNRGTAITCSTTAGVPATINLNVIGTRLVGGLGAYNINGCNWTSLQTGGAIESTSTSSANDLITITETAISNSATVSAAGSGYTASAAGTMTWAGAGCSVNPILNVTSDVSGTISGVSSVATPGICPAASWPTIGATTWTASGPLGAGTNASFNVVQRGQTKAEPNVGGTGYGNLQTGIVTWSGAGCSINPQLVVSTNSSGVITTVNSVAIAGVCTTQPSPTATTWTTAAPLSAGTLASFNMVIAPTITVKTNGQIGAANARPTAKTAWSTNGPGAASATIVSGGVTHGVSATGTLTWLSGGTCSTAPVIMATTNAGQVVTSIGYVLIPGVCTVFPTSTSVWRAGNGLTASADDVTLTLVPNVVVAGRFVYPPSITFPSTQKCNWGEEIPIDPNTQLFTGVLGAATAPVASGSYICALPGTSRQWLGGVQTVNAGTAQVPVCSTALAGLGTFVTDQNTAVAYHGAVTGGGASLQFVRCDGTAYYQD